MEASGFQSALSFKRLGQIRGFLCHLSMLFQMIIPYLKGFHLTLAKHLPQRDESRWKCSETEFVGHIEGKVEEGV